MAKLTLSDLTSTYEAVTTINANNALIETALENTLSRDGTTPNSMTASLDMNSNRMLNLPEGAAAGEPVTVSQLQAAQTDIMAVTAATNVTITDSGGYFDAAHVEGALQEHVEDLAAVTTGDGASLIGVEDSGGFYTAADVEAILAEIMGTPSQTTRTLVEQATLGEVNAGTDDERYITPLILQAQTLVAKRESGSFTTTLGGCTTAPTETVNWIRIGGGGGIVCLSLADDLIATSNTAGLDIDSLPASLQPTGSVDAFVSCRVYDNGAGEMGYARILALGEQINFLMGSPLSTSGFTNSGQKGLELGATIIYSLLG